MRRSRMALITLGLAGGALAACSSDNANEQAEIDRPFEDSLERSTSVLSDAELRAFRVSFQTTLVARYQAARELALAPAPPCADGAKVLGYVEALLANSKATEADSYASACVADASSGAKPLLAAALAAQSTYKYTAALGLMKRAVAVAVGDEVPRMALEYGAMLDSCYDQAAPVEPNVARAAGFASGGASTVSKLFDAGVRLTPAFEAEVLALADRQSPQVAAILIMRLGRVMFNVDYRYHDTFQIYRGARGTKMMTGAPAHRLASIGMHVHQGLMNHRNNAFGYAEGEQLVKATAPYQRKEEPLFNLGFGPYTRAQINTSVCSAVYESSAALKQMQEAYVAGTAKPAALLSQLQGLRSGEHKTNTEVFRGTLLESLGDDVGALEAYWEARQLCPYNARAIAGTIGVTTRLDRKAKPDGFKPVLAVAPPLSLASYVTNNAMLSSSQRSNVAFALQYWWPYLGQMSGPRKGLYITPTFQGLLDTPEMRGKAGYASYRAEDDGRLFDDWEGHGGPTIAASFLTVEDYDWGLIVHEAAHQFHALAAAPIRQCIAKRYAAAKSKNSFVRGYASENEREYFAVGVADYNHPLSKVGKTWMCQNDPNLFALIKSISVSNGDMSKVSCADAVAGACAAAR